MTKTGRMGKVRIAMNCAILANLKQLQKHFSFFAKRNCQKAASVESQMLVIFQLIR
jgi:hypothetical protein